MEIACAVLTAKLIGRASLFWRLLGNKFPAVSLTRIIGGMFFFACRGLCRMGEREMILKSSVPTGSMLGIVKV